LTAYVEIKKIMQSLGLPDYTKDTATNNAELLAKANALGAKDPLAVGTRISVLTALVKNFKRMGTTK
jgi:hypothetical protein